MAAKPGKRALAQKRAVAMYDRLMKFDRPDDISNAEWLRRAGVNTSFFTNLKNGSEPTVGNLRDVLEVVGVSMPEFFRHEALPDKPLAVEKESERPALIGANGPQPLPYGRWRTGSGMAGFSAENARDAGNYETANSSDG